MSKVHKGQVELSGKIDACIAALADSERVTKTQLSVVSRLLLEYLGLNGATHIASVNRLLDVLTPMNRTTAVLFFDHFLHWNYDEGTEHFTNMVKGEKKLDKYAEKVKTFMADESNDIWTWAAANVKVEAKPKDWSSMITKTVSKALAEEQKNGSIALTPAEVLKAVMVAGIAAEDVMNILDDMTGEMPDDVPGAEVITGTEAAVEAANVH